MTDEQQQPEHRDDSDEARLGSYVPEWFQRLRDQHEHEDLRERREERREERQADDG